VQASQPIIQPESAINFAILLGVDASDVKSGLIAKAWKKPEHGCFPLHIGLPGIERRSIASTFMYRDEAGCTNNHSA